MITTLLFDLDDTLLGNDMGVFLPAYFQRLARYLPAGADPQQFVAEMINGTRAMIANNDPARVLLTIFDECFSKGSGLPIEVWQPIFERYYVGDYRELRALTQKWPAARTVLEWAFDRGYEVVVATSPLFTLPAIRERLRWAGVDDFPFARVTTSETSHFAKPRPEYFAEVLGVLGRRPDQALMVGNDWENDILAASAVGIATYWITPGGRVTDSQIPGDEVAASRLDWVDAKPLGRGSIEDFLAWSTQSLDEFAVVPSARSTPAAPPALGLPHLLLGHAAALAGALQDVGESDWRKRPLSSAGTGDTEWSLTEIVCHLRDVEREVNLPRLHAVVESDNPFVAGADTDPWAIERDYQAQYGPAALADFLAARREATRFLRGQPREIWDRTARHAIFGPTRLAEIVGWVLDHDLIHLKQVRDTKERV